MANGEKRPGEKVNDGAPMNGNGSIWRVGSWRDLAKYAITQVPALLILGGVLYGQHLSDQSQNDHELALLNWCADVSSGYEATLPQGP